jgi:hypothetical protein
LHGREFASHNAWGPGGILMRRQQSLAVVTIMLLSAPFWIAEAKADKISLCFATEKFVCANNGHGSSSFVRKTELEVKTMSESSARKAAEGFCKSGKEIKKTTSTGNGVYYLYEADCDKK